MFRASQLLNKVRTISLILLITLIATLNFQPASAANVNDFLIDSFDAQYDLSRNQANRSVLNVTETITVIFPTFDQNRGIERAIPNTYDGHSINLRINSVQRNGQPESIYSEQTQNGNLVLALGDDSFLHGRQVYQIKYTAHDVIKDFGDHQEFYWDTNGTGWRQQFNSVSAVINLSSDLVDSFDLRANCYQGSRGSNTKCQLSINDSGRQIEFKSNGALKKGQNLTMVIGFKPDSFAPFSLEPSQILLMILAPSLALVGFLWQLLSWLKNGRSFKTNRPIVPEYLAPKNSSVLIAANILRLSQPMISAQILSLAVRRKLRIIESDNPSLLNKTQKKYQLELVQNSDLLPGESQFLESFGLVNIGDQADLSRPSYKIRSKITRIISSLTQKSTEEGYRRKVKLPFGAFLFSIASILPILFFSGQVAWMIISPVITILLLIGTMAFLTLTHPLTQKGAELKDYLLGLKMYIKLAEAERLRFAQSPANAKRQPVDINDSAQVLRLYEQLLPYAVLFGLQNEWLKTLGNFYGAYEQNPDWYVGTTIVNVANFSSMINNFSSSVNSYTAPSSSSSSGLGGGGFSGGGGGGGGGGGR